MNGQEKSDIKLVLAEIKSVRTEITQGTKERGELIETVDEIYVCLTGDPKKHEDLGLQGAVVENTRFRKTIKYWLGAIGVASLVTVVKSFWKNIFPN